MKIAARYNTLVCFTALLACLSYCASDDKTFFLGLLSIVGCTIGWYAGRDERPRALPRWAINCLMLAAIIDATLKVLAGRSTAFWIGDTNAPIVSTLSQFLVYILLVKLFDRRTPRDEAHLLSLSIFVVVGAVLSSNSLVVGILILIFAPCIISSAMLLQLVGGAHAVQDANRAAGMPADDLLQLLPSSQRRLRRDFLASAAAAVAGTLFLATFAFVVVPRGVWKDLLGGFGKLHEGAVVGFTDQTRLGQSGLLKNQDDDTPVLDVRLTSIINGKPQDLGEMRGTLYLRGAVKNTYRRESRSWDFEPQIPRRPLPSPGPGNEDLSDITGGLSGLDGGAYGFQTTPDQPLYIGNPSRGQIVIRQEYTLRRPLPDHGYFFSIWRPLEFATDQTTIIVHPGREVVFRAAHTSTPAGLDSLPKLRGYKVTSALEYADPREPARQDVSFDSDVVHTIAAGILHSHNIPLDPAQRDAAGNRRASQAFVDYLRHGFKYSREMAAPLPNEDPIEMFLTRTKAGHCEYFASAMVALCQSVGLDARYIAGYVATEFNRVTGVYVVRESSAHAWAEVRIGPGRWQTVDPSPPEAIEQIRARSTGFFSRLRQWYDALNMTWSAAVVSFDNKQQQSIMGAPQGWVGRLVNRIQGVLAAARSLPPAVAPILRVGVLTVVALVLLFVVPRAWRKRRRARAAKLAAADPLAADPVMARLLDQVGFYRDALDILHRAHLSKPPHRPPALHAQLLTRDHPAVAGVFASLSDLYYRVRFGRRPLSAGELADAQAALTRLDDHLRAASGVTPPAR